MRYTISEMAALLGVTTHTLRYYEKMGLIQPEVNRETGYRYYTVTDTRRFNLCRELRAAGFTLEECKDFLDEPSTAVTDAMLDRQIRQLERRQVLNRMSIRFLQKTREYYHTLEQGIISRDRHRITRSFPSMLCGRGGQRHPASTRVVREAVCRFHQSTKRRRRM